MVSLFASPDIAALVAAFPPPLPTRNSPSLVRSNSGNGLLNSAIILNRFRTLLETEPGRIEKSDLPHRLGIERTDWLFECYDGSPRIRWSRDGGSLIPEPLWNRLIEDLSSRCDENFTSIRSYVKAENVEDLSTKELDQLMETHSLDAIPPPFESQAVDIYLASNNFVAKTKSGIESSLDGASDDKLNLSQLYPTIPLPVLKHLAAEIIPHDQIEINGDGILFVPTNHFTAQQERLRVDREARIQNLLEKFENYDFVQVNTSTQDSAASDAEEICKRYTGLHGDGETPTILDVDAATKVVALPVLLERTIQELKEETIALTSSTFDSSIDTLTDETKSRLCSTCSEPVFATILLQIPSYSDKVSAAMREAQLEKKQKLHNRFSDSFCREVLAPIQLYACGVESISDAKLKSSLNDYICAHFRDDVIISFVKSARANGLMSNDKIKMREADKFVERSAQSKTIDELTAAATKYARKVKLQLPSDEDLAEARREILERKAFGEMSKMTRGSDVLQNLVWILLSAAVEEGTANNLKSPITNGAAAMHSTSLDPTSSLRDRPALFMSPGKDTGRMIKQYSAVAPDDVKTSEKLGIWREKLKSGSEKNNDLEEMIGVAQQAVRGILGRGEERDQSEA